MMALAAWRAGDMKMARRWAEMVITDTETPSGTRSRVEMLMALSDSDRKG